MAAHALQCYESAPLRHRPGTNARWMSRAEAIHWERSPAQDLMRRGLLLLALLAFAAAPTAHAQQGGLRSKIAHLFIFGDGQNPLFLAGTADTSNPASIRSHGSHFVPSAVSENASIIGFLTDAISENVSNIPIGSTSGGETFRFEGGVPVKTSISAGPVFG